VVAWVCGAVKATKKFKGAGWRLWPNGNWGGGNGKGECIVWGFLTAGRFGKEKIRREGGQNRGGGGRGKNGSFRGETWGVARGGIRSSQMNEDVSPYRGGEGRGKGPEKLKVEKTSTAKRKEIKHHDFGEKRGGGNGFAKKVCGRETREKACTQWT